MTQIQNNADESFFHFKAKGWGLFKLILANFFLNLITFGIYFFWARVRLHRFFYYHTEFKDGNFDFHATGKELFILFLKTLLIVIPALALYAGSAYFFLTHGANIYVLIGIYGFIFYLALFGLIPLAVYEIRRFMLARTSWNLKRFSFEAPLKNIYTIYLKGFIFSLLTLGIYNFWFQINLRKYLTNHSFFDGKAFSYRGTGKDIFLMSLLAMILVPLTLGFYFFWFIAKIQRYHWSHTFYSNTRFKSTMTGGGLLKNLFLSFLQTVFTFGIGFPWALVRQKKYAIETICLTNEIIPDDSPVLFSPVKTEVEAMRPPAIQKSLIKDVAPQEKKLKVVYDPKKEVEKSKRLLRKKNSTGSDLFEEDYGDFFD